MCGCTHTVVRITAAVHKALKPILNEMSQKIEQFDNHITTELMKINETLTEQIIINSGGLKCGDI